MTRNRVVALLQKGAIDDPLTEILRTGARRLIAQAVEAEFETFLASTAELVLPGGRQRWFATGMIRFARSGLGSARSKRKSRRPAIAPPLRGSAFASRRTSCPNGRVAHNASTPFCRFSICAGFPPAISRRPSPPCSARTRPTSPLRRSRASRASGRTNIGDGRSAICRRATTSTSGRTASICRRAWSRRPNACWC
jgi:hypothetical protein